MTIQNLSVCVLSTTAQITIATHRLLILHANCRSDNHPDKSPVYIPLVKS